MVDLIKVEQDQLDEENESFYAMKVDQINLELQGLSREAMEFVLSKSYSSRAKGKTFSDEDVRSFFHKEQTKYKSLPHYGSEMTDALVLAQLEADSIATLIDSVVASFAR